MSHKNTKIVVILLIISASILHSAAEYPQDTSIDEAIRNLTEETLPNIAEQFAKLGAINSSEYQEAINLALLNFEKNVTVLLLEPKHSLEDFLESALKIGDINRYLIKKMIFDIPAIITISIGRNSDYKEVIRDYKDVIFNYLKNVGTPEALIVLKYMVYSGKLPHLYLDQATTPNASGWLPEIKNQAILADLKDIKNRYFNTSEYQNLILTYLRTLESPTSLMILKDMVKKREISPDYLYNSTTADLSDWSQEAKLLNARIKILTEIDNIKAECQKRIYDYLKTRGTPLALAILEEKIKLGEIPISLLLDH